MHMMDGLSGLGITDGINWFPIEDGQANTAGRTHRGPVGVLQRSGFFSLCICSSCTISLLEPIRQGASYRYLNVIRRKGSRQGGIVKTGFRIETGATIGIGA